MGDPKLLVLRDHVAVLDARVGELIAGLDRGEAGRHWTLLQALLVEFVNARAAGKVPEMAALLGQITVAINVGASEAMRWAEVMGTMQVQQRLVESERRRMVELQQVLTAREAMLLMHAATGALQEGVKRFVDDPKAQRQILSFVGGEFARLASIGDGDVDTAD